MNLEKLNTDRKNFTKSASEVNRQFALAGIAVIWLFSSLKGGAVCLPIDLKIPLILFFISLFFDFSQYTYLSITWTIKQRKYEKVNGIKDNFNVPLYPAKIGFFLFCCKLACSIIAFITILIYFISHTTYNI